MALLETFETLKYQYFFRKCICVSQSLSALVTTFLSLLEQYQEENPEMLEQWSRIGFLIGWESLISSQGKELRMLSDAWVAIKCLERFHFEFDPTIDHIELQEEKNHEGYIIKIPVRPQHFDVSSPLKDVKIVRVTSVLFTQGINEMQSLANMVGATGVELQSTINNASFKILEQYHQRCVKYHIIGYRSHVVQIKMCSLIHAYYALSYFCRYLSLKIKTTTTSTAQMNMQLLLTRLMAVIQAENAAVKNTRILLEASDVVRRMHGGRVTYCKSGKDRTAMSVTLEQSRLLFKPSSSSSSSSNAMANSTAVVHHHMALGGNTTFNPSDSVSSDELAAANLMREFGIRIEVAKKNVGRYKYSFNAIQRKLLPEMYRPPSNTIQDMMTSVTARDS
jgi:hypothetical protein